MKMKYLENRQNEISWKEILNNIFPQFLNDSEFLRGNCGPETRFYWPSDPIKFLLCRWSRETLGLQEVLSLQPMTMNLCKDLFYPFIHSSVTTVNECRSLWGCLGWGEGLSVCFWQCARVSSWKSMFLVTQGALGHGTGSSLGMIKDPWLSLMSEWFILRKSGLYSQGLEFSPFPDQVRL